MSDSPNKTSDEDLPFSDLERRADGLLFTIFLSVSGALLYLVIARGSASRNFTTIGGVLVFGVFLGLWIGQVAGRGYPGGMFLYAPLRCTLVGLTLIGLVMCSILSAFPTIFAR